MDSNLGLPDTEDEAVLIISHTLQKAGKELVMGRRAAQYPAFFLGHSDRSGFQRFQIDSLFKCVEM